MKVWNLASCTKVTPWVGVANVVRKIGSQKLILVRHACLHAIWGLWALRDLHQVTTCVACMREQCLHYQLGSSCLEPIQGVKQLCFKLLVASSRAVKPSLEVGMAAD